MNEKQNDSSLNSLNEQIDIDDNQDNGALDEQDFNFDNLANDKKLSKEIKKFTTAYNRSYKNSILYDNSLKDIDSAYLKKMRIKRNEIVSLKKKIDLNTQELDKAYETFSLIYNKQINDEIILDTKDKALAQKTLLYRKNIRDIDVKLDKEEKEYKETLKEKEESFAESKKSFTQIVYDLERKKKGEIQKGKKAKAEEIASLNEMLSETNDRTRINAINEHLNVIKKESLEGSKEINEKYLNLRKDEDIKNIERIYEYEKNTLDFENDYTRRKTELEFQKKKYELDYEIESKTYVLAAKRADNNLKKDLIIKKNGVLVNTYDLNKELYNKLLESSLELLDLQKNYNSSIIDKIAKENISRTSLVLQNIKFVSHNLKEKEKNFEDKTSNAFTKSLYYYNELSMKNLNKAVKEEFNTLTDLIRAIYDVNARCDYGYNQINDKVKVYFENFKKTCLDELNQLYSLVTKESKELVKFTSANNAFVKITNDRFNEYKKFMDLINHTIIAFATSSDEEVMKYSDDEKTKEMLINEKSKYFTSEFRTEEEELENIEIIHKKNDEEIALEIEEFKKESEIKKQTLEEEIASKAKEIEDDYSSRLQVIEEKHKNDLDQINESFKENLKNLTGAYKTENKLIKD